ncbi:MAG: hypothetical protein ACXAEU_07025 [Candidatus Hodarchaeales archaeon]|jgi:hypothetical protein
MSEKSEKQDIKEKKVRRPTNYLEDLLKLNSNELKELFDLIEKIGSEGIITRSTGASFGVRGRRSLVKRYKDDFPNLKEKSSKELADLLAGTFIIIHILEHHDTPDDEIEETLSKIELENKEEKYEDFLNKIRDHSVYPEIIFILERFGSRLVEYEGRPISMKIKDTTINFFEVLLTYFDLEGTEKRIRLELNQKHLKAFISFLEELSNEEFE